MANNYLKSIRIAIESIFGGHQKVWQIGDKDEYLFSLGIDPELELSSLGKASGAIAPTRFDAMSGTEIDGAPMWITGAQTTSGVYAYADTGNIAAYSNAYAGADEDPLTTIPTSDGNGLAYYNDYLYAANGTHIYRGGQLSLTAPTFAEYWVATLGMSTLTDTAYPSTRNVEWPNHVLFPHNDGWCYVADYDGANGRIHAFITDNDGTNGRADWDALTLPSGMMPTDMCSYGTDLAIVCSPEGIFNVGSVPESGNAMMLLWDTVRGNNFYKAIDIGEPLATAIANRNGELFVLAGNIDDGCKVLRYLGEDTFAVEAIIEEGSPPPAGAVDVTGNMLAFGGWGSYPVTHASIFSLGYRSGQLPSDSVNNIARAGSDGTLPIITSLKFLERNDRPTIGWRQDTTAKYEIERISGSATYNSVWQSRVINIGKPFVLKRITLPLTADVAAGMTIEVDVLVDNEEVSFGAGDSGLRDINNTNFTDSERIIDLDGLTIEGDHNFYLKLSFTGTTEIAVTFPITFEVEYLDR